MRPSNHTIRTILTLSGLAFVIAPASHAAAQSPQAEVTPATSETSASLAANTFGEPVRSVWEFGLEIQATDKASGIKAAVPVPMEWPEQSVRLLDEHRSDGVGQFKHRNLTKEARQLQFNVNRVSSDQNAIAYETYEVLRRPILKPANPHQLKIADPVPGKLKRFLKPSPYIESRHERIRNIAAQLKEKHGDGPAWEWVESIYRYVREKVEYKFDPQIHSCLEALDSGHGDCEELSSLFIAICRASDIPARAVWIPGHTYPEFYLVDQQGNGHWFPCQAAGIYEFGEMNETRPVLQKGDQFRMPGSRKPVRYVRPTLVAKDPGAGISLEWIARETTDGSADQKPDPSASELDAESSTEPQLTQPTKP